MMVRERGDFCFPPHTHLTPFQFPDQAAAPLEEMTPLVKLSRLSGWVGKKESERIYQERMMTHGQNRRRGVRAPRSSCAGIYIEFEAGASADWVCLLLFISLILLVCVVCVVSGQAFLVNRKLFTLNGVSLYLTTQRVLRCEPEFCLLFDKRFNNKHTKHSHFVQHTRIQWRATTASPHPPV